MKKSASSRRSVSLPREMRISQLRRSRGGIPIVEITMTVPGAVELISHLVRHHPNLLVGRRHCPRHRHSSLVRGRGRELLDRSWIRLRQLSNSRPRRTSLSLPGALTPTEVVTAWRPAPTSSRSSRVRPSVGKVHQGAEYGPAPDSVDCGRRCEPADGRELHLVRGDRYRCRYGIDSNRSHRAAATETNSGTGASLSGFVKDARGQIEPHKQITAVEASAAIEKCEQK